MRRPRQLVLQLAASSWLVSVLVRHVQLVEAGFSGNTPPPAGRWERVVSRENRGWGDLAKASPEFNVVLGDQVFFSDRNTSAEARWALSRCRLLAMTAFGSTVAPCALTGPW